MIFKPPGQYRSVRRIERRLGRLVSAALTGIARQDERFADYVDVHAAAEALRARLCAEKRSWEQQFREGRLAMLALGIPVLIFIGMMLVFVARLRDVWPLLVVEVVGAPLAAAILERARIRGLLRPLRQEVRQLERRARAAGLALRDAGSVAAHETGSTRTRRWEAP